MNTTKQAQHLLYCLTNLIPTIHQRRTFRALLLAFLTPHRDARPTHNPLVSESSISRFLNHYDWPTREIVKLTRRALLQWILQAKRQGPLPSLRVIIDLTCCDKAGKFKKIESWINAMNGHKGVHLVVLYLELGRVRIPWDLRVWKGKGTASPMKLALRMLASLPTVLTEQYHVIVLADSWFASKGFIEGIHERGYQAILGVRPDRTTVDGRRLSDLKRSGQKVMLNGLSIPVWIAWFYFDGRDKPRERRFVLSTEPIGSHRLRKEGRHRWKIEVFFKTIKHTFALSKASQGTGLGMLRFLLLSLLAFVLVFALRPSPAPGEGVPWSDLSRQAATTFLSVVVVMALLAEVERRRTLLERLGMRVEIRRFSCPAHNCKK